MSHVYDIILLVNTIIALSFVLSFLSHSAIYYTHLCYTAYIVGDFNKAVWQISVMAKLSVRHLYWNHGFPTICNSSIK